MKKLLTLALAVAALGLFTACGGDEGFGANEFVVDGNRIPILTVGYADFAEDFSSQPTAQIQALLEGRTDLEVEPTDPTHTVRQIIITNGSEAVPFGEDATFFAFVILISEGGEEFNNGKFPVINVDEIEGETSIENAAFVMAYFMPEEYDGLSEVESISGGNINISGNAPNLTLTFNFGANAYFVPLEVVEGAARTDGEGEAVEVTVKGQFKGEAEEMEEGGIG